jgi:hypothetical protein
MASMFDLSYDNSFNLYIYKAWKKITILPHLNCTDIRPVSVYSVGAGGSAE